MSHFSHSSACDISDVFKALFPDSNIAQGMTCGPTKQSYLITFGIGPYFKQLLVEDLKKASYFVVLFDESLNTELCCEQIDFTVRYFKNDQVMTRYLSSSILGHNTVEDLKLKFEDATQNLQASMYHEAKFQWMGLMSTGKCGAKLLKKEVQLSFTLD